MKVYIPHSDNIDWEAITKQAKVKHSFDVNLEAKEAEIRRQLFGFHQALDYCKRADLKQEILMI